MCVILKGRQQVSGGWTCYLNSDFESPLYSFCNLSYDRSVASSKARSSQWQSSASSFIFQYPLISLRSSSICLRLFHRLPVTFTFPPIFSSIMRFARQFPHNMWSIQLTFLLFNVCIIFLPSLILCNNSSFFTRSVQRISFILLQYHTSKLYTYLCSTFRRKNRPLEEYLASFSVSGNLYHLVTRIRSLEI